MKKLGMLLGLVLGCCCMAANEIQVKEIVLNPGVNAHIWSDTKIKATAARVEGALVLHIVRNDTKLNDFTQVQLMVQQSIDLAAGKHYELSLKLKASEKVAVSCSLMQDQKPYTSLGQNTVTLEKDIARTIRLDIRPQQAVRGIYRIPNLCFGKVPSGVKVTLSDVTLREIQ